MGLLKGNPSITRYRVLDPLPADFTEEFIGERLKKYAFTDIEDSFDESSCGWTELLNYLSAEFPEGSYRFGPNYSFIMRLDTRKLSNKILNRYLAIKVAEFTAENGRNPGARKKKELKDALRLELLRRTLLNTDVYEVVWLTRSSELWFFGTGEKLRTAFEELFGQTFGLSFRLIVPITLGLELVSDKLRMSLLDVQPTLVGIED
jgi:DNA recombination-dependent growth factor C